jgi:hypothetical protein
MTIEAPPMNPFDPDAGEPLDNRKVLVRVSRGGLDIGDRIVSKGLNATNDDWDFTVERAVWRAQRAGNTFTEEDITA